MTAAASWQQTALVDDLLTTIEDNPDSVDARKLLVEQYEALGWDDAARDMARSVIELFPDSTETAQLLDVYGATDTAKSARKTKIKTKTKKSHNKTVKSDTSIEHTALDVQQLGVEFVVLQDDAKALLRELSVLADLAPEIDFSERIAEVTAMAEGRMFSAARGRCGKSTSLNPSAVRSARAVAASVKAEPQKALDIAFFDLEAVMDRTPSSDKSVKSNDITRDALRKRSDAVKSALPADLAYIASEAVMHLEHERLGKTYKNSETMLGDLVSSIARADFWVSEDGYAWDIDELVQAIQAAKGAMRNPLTKESFSTEDVAAILRHPKGKALAALEVEQKQLRKGVRQETIDRLRAMSSTLLSDMSENSLPSHKAIDDFLLYVATLPEAEKQAIDKLRVPAVDSHSRQPFDDTIGDAVKDAKGNRLCFHKAGDLLRQAADFLSRSKAG